MVRNLPKAERKTTTKTRIKQTNISIKKKKKKTEGRVNLAIANKAPVIAKLITMLW